ncbi:unnamed protein product [Microthlaspi erraticum]|uniref:Uncharacterized protein n=1 Tax=Microthlaspi erraticum TaxID=1685480 RepID=A0A6D2JXC1_9BRAS|nr:unnamed protein product [Microthlaspi erraticum]
MTLFPTKFENGKIEYKIRYKGRSRPFSRAKALVTSEQSRDPTKLKELLSQVLTITLDDDQRMEESDAEEYVYSEEQSESERLREERRTKKRNDPISSESEQGEFEIGVNLVQEEGNGLQMRKAVRKLRVKRKEKR